MESRAEIKSCMRNPGDLLLIDTKTGKWRNLTKSRITEADPKFSPDGARIAFRRAWDLYTMDLASGKETRLTSNGSDTLRNGGLDWVYPEEFDLGTAYWWSPDSRSILYLQFNIAGEPQYPHASLLGEKAVYEPQRYPQAGDDNALDSSRSRLGCRWLHAVDQCGRHRENLPDRSRRVDTGFPSRLDRPHEPRAE